MALIGRLKLLLQPTFLAAIARSNPGAASEAELVALRERVKKLEEAVANLDKSEGEVRTIILRIIPREDAKGEILKLFKESEILDYGEIAMRLSLDLPLVVDICNELEREGQIG